MAHCHCINHSGPGGAQNLILELEETPGDIKITNLWPTPVPNEEKCSLTLKEKLTTSGPS